MKRTMYSIGFFLAVLFLCSGFFLSYQVSQMGEKIRTLENDSAMAKQEVSAISNARKQDFIFERYENGELKREAYRISAYGTDHVVLRQEKAGTEPEEQKDFCLQVENGYVVVYRECESQVYEYTDIPLEALPTELQSQVLLGKVLHSQDELYNFLENYSS